MTNKKSKTFPMLPISHWWELRRKFKQSIPGVVTDNYLATALNTKLESARANVLPYLKEMGLIDQDGKTLELAKAWRDDEQYEQVCKKICNNIYPEELTAAVPKPSEDREGTKRWFANQTGAGAAAVGRMAAIYIVIAEADVSKKPQKKDNAKKKPVRSISPKTAVKKPAVSNTSQSPSITPAIPPVDQPTTLSAPGVCINIEIHISSDATPDQIDKIFESMAKHIYKK